MPVSLTQENRLLELITPLGKDKLFIRAINGTDAISQLYFFHVEAFSLNDEVIDFSLLVGQPACIRVNISDTDKQRYYHGVIRTVARNARGAQLTAYSLELVPHFWILTRTTRSRIYQQQTVPDILRDVLTGLKTAWEIQGTFQPRDYCAQYRETDFEFASRLMEEEGIFYYFRHDDTSHTMVLADMPSTHQALPAADAGTMHFDPFVGGVDDPNNIYAWEKTQSLRSGKTTLWDHSFELPGKNLEAQDLITETLQTGTVTHKLKVGGNDQMEIYDYPGGYADRFDGITPSGGEQASELQKIFDDNKRTTKIRMQQEAVNSLSITAYSKFLGIATGYKFTLDGHFEDNDTYVITRSHFAIPQQGGYAAGDEEDTTPPEYQFLCIPFALPFRPQQVTRRPIIHGTQTALVTGPSGEDIFTDKYGRVKVQFNWDRAMKGDGSSSCWVRCAFPWAGKNFGFISIPRVGHEVVVAFEEGDPDRPIIVGSVYNADMMPPWTLPDNKTQSGIQTRTEKGGSTNLNVFQFEDKKDAEFVFLHGEKDYHTRIKNDTLNMHGRDVHRQITRDLIEEIKNEVHRKVLKSVFEEITVNLHTKIAGDEQRLVAGKVARKIDGALHDTIGADHYEKTTGKYHVKANEIAFEADTGISFKVGGCEVVIDTSSVSIKGSSKVAITGGMVNINSGPGSPAKTATAATAAAVTAPKAIVEAKLPGETGTKTYSGTATPDTPRHALSPTSFGAPANQPVARATDDGPAEEAAPATPASTPASTTEEEQQKHYIEIQVNDQNGDPLPGEYFEIITPEGTLASGSTDDKGFARVDGIDPGNATVTFPRRDKSVVE